MNPLANLQEMVSGNEHRIDPAQPSNLVSVVIPAFNGARVLGETLESILSQTVRPAELIVINDGSTDETSHVVRKFGDRISLIETPNQGVCNARNQGAAAATSEWLAFCDQDDLWLPTKIEKQLQLAHEAPDIHFVLADYAEYSGGVVAARSHFSYAPDHFWPAEPCASGFVVRKPITGKLTAFQPAITSATIMRRDFFQSIGGIDPRAGRFTADDTLLHFRCLSVVPFGVVPEVLMLYRRHPDSVSADTQHQLESTIQIWEFILANYPQAEPYRDELSEGLKAMRKEFADNARYRRRQRLKRLLLGQWR